MFEQFILGMIQGTAEWLPVSSEGMIVLVGTKLLPSGTSLETLIETALFLHLGTFFAALIYLSRDVLILLKKLLTYNKASEGTRNILRFLIITTLISGILGYGLLQLTKDIELNDTTGRIITGIVAVFLFITAGLQFLQRSGNRQRKMSNMQLADSLLLGIAQGCAALPGLSRSGLTISALLLRNVDKADALKLSFLMSLPIVLAGNIILNLDSLLLSKEALVGLASSFFFGLITIDILLRLARRINFGYFVLFFACITLISAII